MKRRRTVLSGKAGRARSTAATGPGQSAELVTSAEQADRKRRRMLLLLSVLLLVGLSGTLSSIGLKWGMPQVRSCCSDSIAGIHTVQQRSILFDTWKSKYPRVHYVVANAFYEPFLSKWEKAPVIRRDAQGRTTTSTFDLERVNVLILVSRLISAAMAASAVIAVFLGARALFKDDLTGVLAGLGLAGASQFVYYSHTGNVDVPSVCWYAWGFYCAVKMVASGKWRYYILMPVFCALAAGTKDANVAYVGGLVVGVCIGLVVQARRGGRSWLASLRVLVGPRPLVAAALFLFCFAMINNMITDWQGFRERMDYWFKNRKGISKYTMFKPGFSGQKKQIVRSIQDLHFGMGWPLLCLVGASVVYGLWRFRWKCLFCLLPLLAFYVIVLVRIRFNFPRFFIPAYVGLAVVAAAGAAAWLRFGRLPRWVRAVPIVFVYVTTVLYGLAVSVEMADDSRARAAEWFEQNVSRETPIASLIRPPYGLALRDRGFVRYVYPWKAPELRDDLPRRQFPPYVVTAERWLTATSDKRVQRFHRALLKGELPYQQVAAFDVKYLWPRKTLLGFAGWRLDRFTHGPLSPQVYVYRLE